MRKISLRVSPYKNCRFSVLEGPTPGYKSSYISRIERAICVCTKFWNDHVIKESGEISKKFGRLVLHLDVHGHIWQ